PSSSPSSAAWTASRQAPLVCGETFSRASQAASIVAARSASLMASPDQAEMGNGTMTAPPRPSQPRQRPLFRLRLGPHFGAQRALDVAAGLDQRDPFAGEL